MILLRPSFDFEFESGFESAGVYCLIFDIFVFYFVEVAVLSLLHPLLVALLLLKVLMVVE